MTRQSPIEEFGTHFGLGWKESQWGVEGQKERNRTARELRKHGYDVKTETVSFADLARDRAFLLEAHLQGTPKSPFGCETTYQRKEDA